VVDNLHSIRDQTSASLNRTDIYREKEITSNLSLPRFRKLANPRLRSMANRVVKLKSAGHVSQFKRAPCQRAVTNRRWCRPDGHRLPFADARSGKRAPA
jgi:hypothetical protein